ncbi:DUF5666 domain-containing protein [Nitrosomonas sp. Nm33]|uniref:DUF5666 domain-containing protein n=1 Tax=Nitrosomonas sp. Nm33 TaxID=133724 RepID=UPI000895AD53|nr:DUF5666 domain-containing protein [Nitrosomonas sp. Nm33]SDY11602.1 hypothetical protein SAMN05421755_10081 [Nitrosomonas sp. Nm33]
MNFRHKTFITSLLLLVLSIVMTTTALAKSAELEFKAIVTEINLPSEGESSVRVKLLSNLENNVEIPVMVTGATEIESHGDEIALSELRVGYFVKINGFFRPSGIVVANQIDALDSHLGEYRIRGLIEQVEEAPNDKLVTVWHDDIMSAPTVEFMPNGRRITVIDVPVQVDTNTAIRRREMGVSRGLTMEALQPGQSVDIKGVFNNGVFLAERIEVGHRPEGEIKLKGTVASVANGSVSIVNVSGVNMAVVPNDTTKVRGNLAVGELIEVKGHFNKNMQVVAEEIKVDVNRNGHTGDDHDFSRRS